MIARQNRNKTIFGGVYAYMQYLGKIIGVTFSIIANTGFLGIILGLVIGHIFDKAHSRKLIWSSSQQERHTIFLSTTFEVMGHLTKSKGRVTEADIQVASIFMDRMNLYGESRTAGQNAFRIGKADNYPLREKLRQFRIVCLGRFDLIRMFLEIQIQAAFADGSLHQNERGILYIIAEELGISRSQFDQFLHIIQGETQFNDSGGYQQQQSSSSNWQQEKQRNSTLKDAYNVLGIQISDDTLTIKRAYRKLMSRYHPDKLVAKGLPPKTVEIAKQKAQEIQKAYEIIKEWKGFK